MPLKLRCTSCDRTLHVPRRRAGQTVSCPSCGAQLVVPAESAAQTLPRPPALTARQQDEPPAAGEPAFPPPPLPDSPPQPTGELAPPPPVPPPLPTDVDSVQPPNNTGSPTAAAPPPIPPPPMPPPSGSAPVPLPGVEHDWIRRWPVYQLGMWVIAAAVVSVIPALLDVIQRAPQTDSAGSSRWALMLLLAGGLQIAYAVYLMQIPDWGTAWVVSIVMLVFATAYAALLGALTLANQQSQLVQFLELGDKLPGRQATTWCLIMLALAGLLAYFSGRISFRWRRTYWRWARPKGAEYRNP